MRNVVIAVPPAPTCDHCATSLLPALSRRLQKTPQAPRRRYRVAYWTPAVAQTTAPRLSAFGHRRCSCLAAAAPLRRPAKRLLACLRLAGGYRVTSCTPPSRDKAASRLRLSCNRRPASADFCPGLALSLLPAACAVSIKPLTAPAATPGCRSPSCTSWPAAAYLR